MILNSFQVLLAPSKSTQCIPFSAKLAKLSPLPKEAGGLNIGLSNVRGFCNSDKQAYYIKTAATLKLDILLVVDVKMKKFKLSRAESWAKALGTYSNFTFRVGLIVFNQDVTK
ncbi:hypothetical protein DSO57_1013051 [Entomophthora muscae]|uniref:Uncharacterized protein n=1 Tax=Entomophthora muscae TaxID=34485 RepID=A0ACC2RX45_9FUNG|nr:hypothetical protein DSO57_1013051 [Entomophthora muscae]